MKKEYTEKEIVEIKRSAFEFGLQRAHALLRPNHRDASNCLINDISWCQEALAAYPDPVVLRTVVQGENFKVEYRCNNGVLEVRDVDSTWREASRSAPQILELADLINNPIEK